MTGIAAPRLLIRRDAAAPVVALQAWIDVGAADEQDHEHGACHLVEHMLFRGSRDLASGELAARIEGAGGAVNAFTTPDQVVVQATMPSRAFEQVVEPLADAVLRPGFDTDALATEKQVVLEELRRDLDAPGRQLSRLVAATRWRLHPYRRPLAGTPECVAELDGETLRAFHRRWFRPDRITLAVVGDLEPASARPILGAFGPRTRDPAPSRRRTPEPEQLETRCAVRRGPFDSARFELALPGTSVGDPATPLLDLLILCLGQGRASRLNREVRLRRRLVDGLSAGSWSPADPGLITLTGLTTDDRVLDAVAACLDVARGLTEATLGPAELDRAKACIEAERDYERETMDGQARTLGYWAVAGGGPEAERVYRQAVREATAEDVLHAARRFLRSDRLTAALLVPEGCDIDEGRLRAAVDGRLPPHPDPVRLPRRRAPAQQSATARTSRRADPAVTRELPSGARVRIEPRRSAPIFALRLLFEGGLRAETAADCGIHALLARCWTRGTAELDSHALALATERLGGAIIGAAGWSSFGLAAGFPTRNLEPAFELLEAILLRPALDPRTFEQERSMALEAVRRERDRPGALAFRRFAALRYGAHPWGLPTAGTEATLEAFGVADLRGLLQRQVRSGSAVLALVGDVDAGELADRVGRLLERLPDGRPEIVAPPAPTSPDGPVCEHVTSRRELAHLVVGFPAPDAADPDGPGLDLLHKLLSGQSGRLFRELRDRRGLVYEVGSVGATGIEPGWFAVYLATDPARLPEARDAVRSELERLVQEPIDPAELEPARAALQGSFQIGRQSYSAVVDARADDALCGLGWEYSDGFCERLDRFGPEDVRRVARRIIDPSRAIEVVAGPGDGS